MSATAAGKVWASICRERLRVLSSDLTVATWADRYRVLSSESAAIYGKWSTLPFQRGPFDAVSDRKVYRVVIKSATQMLKTETILNGIGYFAHMDPGPILVLQPRDADAKAFSKERISPMIRDTPALRAMLQEAVNEGILPVNPIMKLGKFYRSVKKVKEKIDPFTIEELHQIEEKYRERFPDFYTFILCLAWTGMRIGEVTALQWHDIDFVKNYIIVRRNIPHHRQVETTKTVASQRKVDMSPELAPELKQLRTERKKQALADGTTFDMEEWAFRTDEGTQIYYTNLLRRVWHKVQDISKVRRRTPHDLRHSWTSHMLASGADLAYVSAQLGHANPSITLRIYSHWVPGMRRITSAVLDTNASKMQMLALEEEK